MFKAWLPFQGARLVIQELLTLDVPFGFQWGGAPSRMLEIGYPVPRVRQLVHGWRTSCKCKPSRSQAM